MFPKIQKGGNMFTDFKIDYNIQTNDYNNKHNLLIIISLLHANGFINNASINALFKSLREGKLYRNINTYHSRINNQWYNYENIYEVYIDVFESMMNPKDPKIRLRLERMNKMRKINGLPLKKYTKTLTFEQILKYLNLYLNRNRNYCIDYLYNEYIKPSILKAEYNFGPLNDMFNYDFSNLERYVSYSSYDGYCCEDCDGPYERFLEYHDSEKNKAIRKEIARIVSEFLNEKRTKFKGSYKEYTV